MVHFGVGNNLYRVITVLSFVGEFPFYSVGLIGNSRELKKIIRKGCLVQTIRNDATKEEISCRLFNLSGKGYAKTLRLNKDCLPILHWIDCRAYDYYMGAYNDHNFPGDKQHIERNHRLAEASVMFLMSGVRVVPYTLPQLQNRAICMMIKDRPAYYSAKEIKRISTDEMNKTMFTRIVGALFTIDSCYAVYNTRKSIMKWSGLGEFKTINNLTDVARLNAGIRYVDSAILFGKSYETAISTIIESDKSERIEFRFDGIYRHIYFIPLDEYGLRQLKLMYLQNWNERLNRLLFGDAYVCPEERTFEYDAFIDNKYIFSFLDSDIARLIRFKEAVLSDDGRCYEIICYPYQLENIRQYIGDAVLYKTIDIERLERRKTDL